MVAEIVIYNRSNRANVPANNFHEFMQVLYNKLFVAIRYTVGNGIFISRLKQPLLRGRERIALRDSCTQ